MARRQYVGKTRICETELRTADYVRAANLFNLTCDELKLPDDLYEEGIADFRKTVETRFKILRKQYFPRQYGKDKVEAYQACRAEITNAKELILDTFGYNKLFIKVCDGNSIRVIDGEDLRVGTRIHKVFDYCNATVPLDFRDYFIPEKFCKDCYLPHEVAQINKVLNIDFEALDPTLQEQAMWLAAALEEFEGH